MTKAKAASPQAGRFSEPSSQPDDAAISMARQTNSGRSAVTKHLLNCSVHVAVAALCLGVMIDRMTAGSFTRGCAARDLQLLRLIEERENTNAVSAETLSDAMLTMMNARMTCYGGHVVDALAIYDSVAGSLSPNNLSQTMSPEPTGRAR
jgi:hypothetical protein